jgi:hypothetical protein
VCGRCGGTCGVCVLYMHRTECGCVCVYVCVYAWGVHGAYVWWVCVWCLCVGDVGGLFVWCVCSSPLKDALWLEILRAFFPFICSSGAEAHAPNTLPHPCAVWGLPGSPPTPGLLACNSPQLWGPASLTQSRLCLLPPVEDLLSPKSCEGMARLGPEEYCHLCGLCIWGLLSRHPQFYLGLEGSFTTACVGSCVSMLPEVASVSPRLSYQHILKTLSSSPPPQHPFLFSSAQHWPCALGSALPAAAPDRPPPQRRVLVQKHQLPVTPCPPPDLCLSLSGSWPSAEATCELTCRVGPTPTLTRALCALAGPGRLLWRLALVVSGLRSTPAFLRVWKGHGIAAGARWTWAAASPKGCRGCRSPPGEERVSMALQD